MSEENECLACSRSSLLAGVFLAVLGLVTFWREATSSALFGDEWARASEIIFGVGQCPSNTSLFLRPLQGCYFAVLRAVWGQAFVLYRFTALAWHVLSAILLFQILCRVIPSHRLVSLSAAALFVVYPANFTLLFLENGYHRLALALFLAGILILVSAPRPASSRTVIAATLLFLVSLLLYEAHLGLLLLMSVGLIAWARRGPRTLRAWHAVPLVLSLAFLIGRWFAQLWHDGAFGHTAESLSASPVELVTRMLVALRVLFQWAWTSAIAKFIPYRDWPVALVTAGIVVIVAVGATMMYHKTSVRGVSRIDPHDVRTLALMVLSGIGAAAAGYVPMIVAVNPDLSYIGSRLHYVPSIGAAVAIAAAVYLVGSFFLGSRLAKAGFAGLCVLLLLLGAMAHWQSQSCTASMWASQSSLWRQMVRLAPDFVPGSTVGIVVKNPVECYGGPAVFQSGASGVEGALSLVYGHRDLGGWFAYPNGEAYSAVPPGELSTDTECRTVFLYDHVADELVLLNTSSPEYGRSELRCILSVPAGSVTWRELVR